MSDYNNGVTLADIFAFRFTTTEILPPLGFDCIPV